MYFGAPANATFNLPLNTTTDVGTFTLEKQQLDQLFIDGPSEFSNHLGGQQYKLNAYDTLNRAITSIALRGMASGHRQGYRSIYTKRVFACQFELFGGIELEHYG